LTADIERMLQEFESSLTSQFSSALLQTADEIAPARQFVEGASRIVSDIDPGNAIVLSEPVPDLRTRTLIYQLHMQSFESAPITISIQQQGSAFYIDNRGPISVEQLAGDFQTLALEFFKPKPRPVAGRPAETGGIEAAQPSDTESTSPNLGRANQPPPNVKVISAWLRRS
jgi:hypothetical protein